MSSTGWDDLFPNDALVDAVSVTAARERLGHVIERAHRTRAPIRITRHRRPVAVLLAPEVFERLVEHAEEGVGRIALAEARGEGGDSIPHQAQGGDPTRDQSGAWLGSGAEDVDPAIMAEVRADLGLR